MKRAPVSPTRLVHGIVSLDPPTIRCDGCVAFHSKAAVKHGATRDEVMETMGMALYMGAGPSLMYAAQAVEAFDQFSDQAKQ